MARLLDTDISRLVDLHREVRELADSLGLEQLVISANATESHSVSRLIGTIEKLNVDVEKDGERVCMEYVYE